MRGVFASAFARGKDCMAIIRGVAIAPKTIMLVIVWTIGGYG